MDPGSTRPLGWIGTSGRLRRASTGVVLLGSWIAVLVVAPAWSAPWAALLSAALVGGGTLSLLQARTAT